MRYEEALTKHEPLTPYERGLVDGIYAYAWMKDGVYYVGTAGTRLGDAIDRKLTEHREKHPSSLVADEVERPRSCPERGAIPAFDAGWDGHKVGLERRTVEVLATDTEGRAWALMGYDCRAQLSLAETA